MDDATYSDETLTGESGEAFRGVRRATIAARVDAASGFEWLREITRNHLPHGTEPKATFVLQLAESNPTVRDLVANGVGASSIAIIDLSESYLQIFSDMAALIGEAPPSRSQALNLMLPSPMRSERVGKVLAYARTHSLHRTIIPRVERMLKEVAKSAGLGAGDDHSLFDRQALQELDQRGFQELVARFSLALGDAIAPERWKAAVLTALDDHRFLSEGYVSFATLGEAVGADRYFDAGNAKAFASVRAAHAAVVTVLVEANAQFFGREVRAGRLREEDSISLLGVQAADIAARFAARLYERHPEDRRAGALLVKQHVDRVLLNNEWL